MKDWLVVQGDKLFPTDLTGKGRSRERVYLELIWSKLLSRGAQTFLPVDLVKD